MTTRGLAPDQLALEPLTHSYDDIVQTLKNVGYEEGETLFVASWDWRVPVAERDGSLDGTLTNVTAASMTDWATQGFETSLDYLGYFFDQVAAKGYESVDLITHSTGGLVARAYIQSSAYGQMYDSDDDNIPDRTLPTVDDLILAGVPSAGVSQTWGNLWDDWNLKSATRLLGRVVDAAWDLAHDPVSPATITGPAGDITAANLAPDDPNTPADESKQDFVRRYIGAAHDLIATYEFIDVGADGAFEKLIDVTDVDLAALANTLVADINHGTGPENMVARAGDGKTVVVYSDDLATRGQVIQRNGFTPTAKLQNELPSFTQVIGRLPESGEIWYEDVDIAGDGDGTVPTISARGPFDDITGDTGGRLIIDLINDPGGGEVDHGGLVVLPFAQKAIVDRLLESGSVELSDVSQDLMANKAQALVHSIALGLLDEKDMVLTLLDDVSRLLDDFSGLEALNQDLPLLGTSVMDVLPFVTTFRNGIATARNAVSAADPLSSLEEALEDALGFDEGPGQPDIDNPKVGIRFENGQLALDFAFRPSASTTASFNPGDLFQDPIELQLGVGLNLEASIGIDLTDTTAGKDMVFVQLHDLTATATVDQTDLDLMLVVPGVGSAGITNGEVHFEASVTAELVDPNADGKLSLTELLDGLKNLSEFVDVTAIGAIDATLPLTVTVAGFNLSDYGTPVVTVRGDNILQTAPQFGVDIQISPDLRDQILGVLQDLDDKLGPALEGLDGLLATQLPVVGTSVGGLLGVSDVTAMFRLRDIAEPYLNDASFTYTGSSFWPAILSKSSERSRCPS